LLVQNHTDPLVKDEIGQILFSFGPFILDVSRSLLSCNGEEVSLRPKSFDVLTYLLKHPGRLVSRDELISAVWPDVIVTDDSLTQCLTEIRRALGDDQREIVRTVPRRGYLFELPVEASVATATEPAQQVRSWWRLPSLWTVSALMILAIAVGVSWWRSGSHSGQATPNQVAASPPSEASIAVLPFVDLSEKGDQEFLSYGISEEILNLLSQVDGLTVISRTSSFSFADQDLDIETIASRLNVTHVLEGSVRKSGDKIRVTAQLIDGDSGVHLWSQAYDDQLDDVFALQSSIASAITGLLTSRLLPTNDAGIVLSESVLVPENLDAWGSYLRGKYFYGRRADGDIIRAQREFEKALEFDPEFAAAWSGFASSLFVRYGQDELPEDQKLTKAEAGPLIKNAVEKALALDPRNPEASMRLVMLYWMEGQYSAAVEQMNLAMRYGRNNALVQAILAGIAKNSAGPETAVKLQRRAVRLDPLSNLHLVTLAYYLYLAGQLDESLAVLQQASEINGGNTSQNLQIRLWIAILQQEYTRAAPLAAELPEGASRDQARAMLHSQAGNDAQATAALDRLKQRGTLLSHAAVVDVLSIQGEVDSAFNALDQLTAEMLNAPESAYPEEVFDRLRLSPFLKRLHSDPRWNSWLKKAGGMFNIPYAEKVARSLADYAEAGSNDEKSS